MGSTPKRMCKWDKKHLKKDLEAFSESVSAPQYVCAKCIRVANSKKNLCDPQSLEG